MNRPDTDLSALLSGAGDLYRGFDKGAASYVAERLAALASSDSRVTVPDPKGPGLSAAAGLATALTAETALTLTDTIPGDLSRLPWEEGTIPMPGGFGGKSMFCTLVGPGSLIPADAYYVGLYLQSPHADYPRHAHAAEEFYIVLSGSAEWEKGHDGYAIQPPGALIHHAPDQWHAMRTGDEPLLALWAWTGDLSDESFRFEEPV